MTPSRLLLPFSWLYGAAVALRNLVFDIGLARVEKCQVPVISVGNISAGGTGKTPFVVELVSFLQKLGRKPAVLSRGYGRRSKGFQVVSNGIQRCAEAITAGDEPALFAEKLNGVPVVVDEKRVRGARKAVELFSPDVIVLDDGFQHRSLFRDCDIVLMTAEELTMPAALLPAGYRREPLRALKRAHLIVVSKCTDLEEFRKASADLQSRFHLPVIGLRTSMEKIREFGTRKEFDREALRGKKVVAFSGIADASSFDSTLDGLGANVLAHHRFRDHHWYTSDDLRKIGESFQAGGAEFLATTEKDMVRLGDGVGSLERLPILGIEVRSEIIAGESELQAVLRKVFGEN